MFFYYIETTLRHRCSPANLLHIFRTTFPKNTSEWLLLFQMFLYYCLVWENLFLPSWMSPVIQLLSSKLSFWKSWFLICNCMMMFLDAFSSNKNLFCSRKISLTSVNFSISEKWSLVAFSLLESRRVGEIFGGQGRFL